MIFKKKKNVFYDKVLNDEQILTYAKIVDKFKEGEIDYAHLKSMFSNYGVEIDAVLRDFSARKMTIDESKTFDKRMKAHDYEYNDVNYFLLNNLELKNVIFRLDYKAMEILAKAGMPKYQELVGSPEIFFVANDSENKKSNKSK